LACGDYDRTRAIKDGRVRIEGCDITYIPLEPEQVFRARYEEFDVSELSFSSYLLQTSRGESRYIGIPAFVSRVSAMVASSTGKMACARAVSGTSPHETWQWTIF
jgi:4,5-dihydroxyphthalate decarboxylase